LKKKPRILRVEKNGSIPWYEQIKKTVSFPHESGEQIYYSIKPSDYVAVLAQTPDGKIIVVRQFRPAIEAFVFELPSGHVEDGETPEEAIIRELAEETNCRAGNVVLLGENYPDTGRLENRQWADPDKNGGIEVYLVSQRELFEMINEGKFRHALDLCVVALAISRGYLKAYNNI
jgi:ADP-ribose pyrophosphatase